MNRMKNHPFKYAKLSIDNEIEFVYGFVKNWGDINKKGHYFGVFFEHAHRSHHLATQEYLMTS